MIPLLIADTALLPIFFFLRWKLEINCIREQHLFNFLLKERRISIASFKKKKKQPLVALHDAHNSTPYKLLTIYVWSVLSGRVAL